MGRFEPLDLDSTATIKLGKKERGTPAMNSSQTVAVSPSASNYSSALSNPAKERTIH
jgi:hypothetical protein